MSHIKGIDPRNISKWKGCVFKGKIQSNYANEVLNNINISYIDTEILNNLINFLFNNLFKESKYISL